MIDEDAIRKAFAELRARVAYLEQVAGLFAPDEDLDGPKGDPTVRFDPRGWRGEPCKGRRYSECPPALLEIVAEFLTWAAANPQPGKEKFAAGNRKDAARARSWARRLRARGVPEHGAARPASTPPPAGAPPLGRPPPLGSSPFAKPPPPAAALPDLFEDESDVPDFPEFG